MGLNMVSDTWLSRINKSRQNMRLVRRVPSPRQWLPGLATQGGDEGPEGDEAAEVPTEGRKCLDEAITSVLNVFEAVGSLSRQDSNEGGSSAAATEPTCGFFVSCQTYSALLSVAHDRPATREAIQGRSGSRAKPETKARKIRTPS